MRVAWEIGESGTRILTIPDEDLEGLSPKQREETIQGARRS
jgi:hypothetical protein